MATRNWVAIGIIGLALGLAVPRATDRAHADPTVGTTPSFLKVGTKYATNLPMSDFTVLEIAEGGWVKADLEEEGHEILRGIWLNTNLMQRIAVAGP